MVDMTFHRSEPTTGEPAGAVVVLPELFGLSPHVLAVCDTLACDGFRALAPDLYHRTPGATVLPEDAAGRDRGFELLAALTLENVVDDVSSAIAAATDDGLPLAGIVGLSVGGHLALRAAAELPIPAAVLAYPGWLTSTATPIPCTTPALDALPRVRARLLVLVGEDDHVIPRQEQRAIAAAFGSRLDRVLHTYPRVGHGYLAPHRPSYDETAAADSWARIVGHLRTVASMAPSRSISSLTSSPGRSQG